MTPNPKPDPASNGPVSCKCGHAMPAHRYGKGFYDVLGAYYKCDYVGCPCRRYVRRGQ